MRYELDITGVKKKETYLLNDNFSGSSKSGDTLAFNNYYLEKNSKPYFGISGEMHFSRMEKKRWRDELIKARMGGIRVISTYVIWIHHEEEEGIFDFTGNRDIRGFVSLCKELGLYVILRVGPFAHGEVRNGGLPDWLYGKPFEVRTRNEAFLSLAGIWYEKIAEQVKGLFFSEDGPIIGVQIDNEYMHSSAPWEMTTGISNEWVFAGDGGNDYMLDLKRIAAEKGLLPVFYTCTAWGGAMAPDSLMPLWGGYAFRPWIFYKKREDQKEHPATEEYRYQDFHKNGVVCTNDFKPNYAPETRPYACCEMGGGMMCSYDYRFQLDFKSVDAMANIKLASGCNFLGYYMYHGGTNPIGKYGTFLNENQVEKRSYDYQAAIGEFGQIRESYQRLKSLHLFATTFENRLCALTTVLPAGASDIAPTDKNTLRFAVRTDNNRGFLFVNNYQDHFALPDRQDDEVTLKTAGGDITFPINLTSGENAILPFRFDMDGIELLYATAQPVTKVEGMGESCYIFLVPDGMKGTFTFENGVTIDGEPTNKKVIPEDADALLFSVQKETQRMKVLAVSREFSNRMYLTGDGTLIFTDAALLEDEKGLRLETRKDKNILYTYPEDALKNSGLKKSKERLFGIFGVYEAVTEKITLTATLKQVANSRYTVEVPELFGLPVKEVMLRTTYYGDIGNAFLGNEMIHDNFSNGAVWEFGLTAYAERLKGQPVVLAITPKKQGVRVDAQSAMASRREEADAIIGKVEKVELAPVYEIRIR